MTSLLERLRRAFPDASGRTLRQMLVQGRVLVGDEVNRRGDAPVPEDVPIRVLPRGAARSAAVVGIPVVHLDRHLIVVDKPPGLLSVSPRATGRESAWSLLRHGLGGQGKRSTVHLVHRLDRAASGLLVFARDAATRAALKDLFSRHDVDRRYAALVQGWMHPPDGELRAELIEIGGPAHRVRRLREGDGERLRDRARKAVTQYSTRGFARGVTALELRLSTGRKHQIRVQLAESGHPILGDRLYGGPPAPRLFLHAALLGFRHPATGEALRLVSDPGRAFSKLVPRAFEPW